MGSMWTVRLSMTSAKFILAATRACTMMKALRCGGAMTTQAIILGQATALQGRGLSGLPQIAATFTGAALAGLATALEPTKTADQTPWERAGIVTMGSMWTVRLSMTSAKFILAATRACTMMKALRCGGAITTQAIILGQATALQGRGLSGLPQIAATFTGAALAGLATALEPTKT